MTNPVGRPSEYTQETADAICELLSLGWSLKRVIEKGESEEGYEHIKFPSIATVFKWMRDNEEFLKAYARAKREAADAMAEELLDIADNGENDWMQIYRGDHPTWVINGEALQRSKLRVDTRKFLMAKMKPKRYGDKLDLTSDGERIEMPPLVISKIKARHDPDAETETTSGS